MTLPATNTGNILIIIIIIIIIIIMIIISYQLRLRAEVQTLSKAFQYYQVGNPSKQINVEGT